MKRYLLSLLYFLSVMSYAQDVDHWETVVREGDTFSYLVPVSQPSSNWTDLLFDDSGWSSGPSGFGYGDNDDQTVIPATMSVYIRRIFTVQDLADIGELILHMDFDDGFVAYINGTEVARSQVSGSPPVFDQGASGLHEARLYRGVAPEGYNLSSNILVQGQNILAVEVHNDNIGSSDLTANPFLSVGLMSAGSTYYDPPEWFVPPLNFTSSDLPIVIIETVNQQSIPDDPKIPGRIGIIYNGPGIRNNVSDPFNNLDWTIGIELRGESSQGFAKKSYGIEFWDELGNDIDTTFLNFPSEEDFILYGPYSDKTQLNNVLTMHLAKKMGYYASRTRFVELMINGDYKGLYVIMEKIKRDGQRVDIAKLNPDEISGDDLTGGYIFRIDKGVYDGWVSKYDRYNRSGDPLVFQFYYPSEDDIVPQQAAYLQSYMDSFEDAVYAASGFNAQRRHYTEYIDLRSFVDTHILNEVAKNIDAYRLSSYFNKDKESKGGKVKAGPFWDFNLAFGNADYCGGDNTEGWEYYQCDNHPFWWHNMRQDTIFTNAMRCRWEDLRAREFSTARMNATIDSLVSLVDEAQVRNYQRWPVLGVPLWPNPSYFANANSYSEVIYVMKDWLGRRMSWMDSNVPGTARHCEIYEDFNYRDVILGLEDTYDRHLEVYPVPSSSTITIRYVQSIREVRLLNMAGQELKIFKPDSIIWEMPVSDIPHGVYVLMISAGDKIMARRIEIN